MAEEFDINSTGEQPVQSQYAQTTAQTAAEAPQGSVGYNTAAQQQQPTAYAGSYTEQNAYAPNQNYQYGGNAGQQPYPVYYAQPVYAAPAKKEHKLSTPARVLLWICGSAVALTLLFGCGVLCVLGARAVLNSGSGTMTVPDNGGFPDSGSIDPYGGYSYNYGNGDSNPFSGFGIPDDFWEYYNNGGMGGGANGGSQQQSSGAGLGITATQVELEFEIDDKYSSGLVIVKIEENSSFTGTDVKENDMIVAMDGKATPSLNEFKAQLGQMQPGDKTTLTIARYENGVATTFEQEVTLIELEAE